MIAVVLVGGRSTRFGRDKLKEPLADGSWLVDRAIDALRAATGGPVTLVGDCDPAVAARGDSVLADAHGGHGPAGGILTALERSGEDVLVLAGDLPNVGPESVRALLDRARAAPDALVIRARAEGSSSPEPCVAIYRAALTTRLAERLRAGRRSLFDLATPQETVDVELPRRELVNANTPSALVE